MDLWIRSQDKEYLCKAHDLIIRESNDDNKDIIYEIVNCYTMGYYATKERALEVLDEIQSLIETNFDCCYNKEHDTYFDCHDIYEMPKEWGVVWN